MLWFHLLLASQVSAALAGVIPAQEPNLDEIARRYTKRTAGGVHLPIMRKETRGLKRRGANGAIGLGDYIDVSYMVRMTIGGITTSLILDSGSSDLWVMSDACTTGCTGGATVYPQASFNYSGLDVAMAYGDSRTGTYADGKIGDDTVALAGLTLQNQYFSAINRTNTSVPNTGTAGIFGLGFPINSVIWNDLFVAQRKQQQIRKKRDEPTLPKPITKLGTPFPDLSFWTSKFPTFPASLVGSSPGLKTRQTKTSSTLYSIFASYLTYGPFLPRLVATSGLSQPMFSVTLQRDTVDIGGAVGQLSIGELPSGVTSDNMTWAPLRLYTVAQGGLPAPPDSPTEMYPITWEVMVDGVYLDGELLPQSTTSPPTNGLSALVDTGNSLIRGPSDTIALIQSKLGTKGHFPCSQPHTLAFKIGGTMFPVDPRDFATQAFENNVVTCTSNLAATDPPKAVGYQFAWSLGTPFLKGVLSSFYYGNLTYPTADPPKMGFLSTVPNNASEQMINAVSAAAKANNNFPAISETAPAGTLVSAQTDANGIPEATNAPAITGTQRTTSSAFRVTPLDTGFSNTWTYWTSLVLVFSLASL